MAFTRNPNKRTPHTDVGALLVLMHEVNAPENLPDTKDPHRWLDNFESRFNKMDQTLSAATAGGIRGPALEARGLLRELARQTMKLTTKIPTKDLVSKHRAYDLLWMIYSTLGDKEPAGIFLGKADAVAVQLHQADRP